MSNVAVTDEGAAETIGDVAYRGPDAVIRLIEDTQADVVLNALVGRSA
ncbi:1-deoxy-D-xylulose 5-phosphate reductoisomerase domain protein [Mycobacterium xenopi 3993]|nr:1-deoxy-D-xylulose 5-phosphate reductoisomerase domain protein [Mycobacterium xenopi 3993]